MPINFGEMHNPTYICPREALLFDRRRPMFLLSTLDIALSVGLHLDQRTCLCHGPTTLHHHAASAGQNAATIRGLGILTFGPCAHLIASLLHASRTHPLEGDGAPPCGPPAVARSWLGSSSDRDVGNSNSSCSCLPFTFHEDLHFRVYLILHFLLPCCWPNVKGRSPHEQRHPAG